MIRYILIGVTAASLEYAGFFDNMIPDELSIIHEASRLKAAWCTASAQEQAESIIEIKDISFDIKC